MATIGEKYYDPKDEEEKEKNKNAKHMELEEEANRNTIGYVERYRTHALYLERNLPNPNDNYKSHFRCANVCSKLVESIERPPPNPPERIVGQGDNERLVLIHEPRENCDANSPFWVVKVDKEIINRHDGFTTSYFKDFVVNLIDRKVMERKGIKSQKPD